jgi:hypothetical protein
MSDFLDSIGHRSRLAIVAQLGIPVSEVSVDGTALKGGYIASVFRLHLSYAEEERKPEYPSTAIIKYDSGQAGEMNAIANALVLYGR